VGLIGGLGPWDYWKRPWGRWRKHLRRILGDFDEGVVFNAVIGDEDGVHSLFAHLGDDFGGFRMVTAENDRLGLAFLIF
jgi:hypothetical protein